MQQLSGVNSITYYVYASPTLPKTKTLLRKIASPTSLYSPTLLIRFLGTTRYTSLWVAGLTSVVSVTFTLFPVFFIDRLGRIPLLVGGAVAQSVCFIIVAALLASTPENSYSYGFGIIFFIFMYFAIFSSTWLAGSWLYREYPPTKHTPFSGSSFKSNEKSGLAAEILPLRVRGSGASMGVFCYWMFNFLVSHPIPPPTKPTA